ncbi:hypothetical protein XENTR_v10004667 [Xenopus tropicalis]|nr:hypothetical protein XENTR_v10004667 [Xenopus tropicalis]
MAGGGSARGHWLQWAVRLVLIAWAVRAQDTNLTCSDFQTSGIFQDNQLQVQFLLFTFQNRNCGQVIDWGNAESIGDSPFNSTRDTKILIHGFRALGTKPSWIDDMVDALLGATDANVVAVDWVSGSTAKYNQAVENIPRLSGEVAELIKHLLELGVTEESLHLIGISLGAHAAGLVGQMFGGRIGHITGLDPAGYKFKKAPPEERLDPGDAMFVEAIHTDTDSFGISIPVGHVDYFINGGRDQPGCPSVRHSREDILANPRTQIISQEAQVFLMTTAKEPFCAHHMLLVFSLPEPRDSTLTIEIELKSETSSSKTKISIAGGHLEGRAVLAHSAPLCEIQMAVLRYPGSILSFWRGKTEIRGTFCVSEMPLGDRAERRCLPQTVMLSGNSRHSYNLQTAGRPGGHSDPWEEN